MDDASITPAGHAQIEAWLSRTRTSTIANVIPAVTLRSIPDIEWSIALNGTRFQGSEEDRLTFQGKRQLRPAEDRQAGFAITGNIVIDARSGRPAASFAYGVVTIQVGNRILVHANTGIGHELSERPPIAVSWGIRSEAAVMPDRLALHGEVFGTSATGTGVQAGLRPTVLNGHVDLEFVYARNLAGERRNWFTLGLAARF